VGEHKGKKPLGRPRRIWEDNIKIDLQEVVWGEWPGLVWLRYGQVLGSSECGDELSRSINCGEFLY
jgi:hypothetical protein